jgi:threonine/homoserine/homoserine lactone efflux protein
MKCKLSARPPPRQLDMQRKCLATGSLTVPEQDAYIAFLGALLAYQLAGPGPDMILVITRGVAQGRRSALATAVGCVSAGFIQIPLLVLGLASIINASPLAHEVLRWTGAAYLVFTGVRLLISSRRSWLPKSRPFVAHRWQPRSGRASSPI